MILGLDETQSSTAEPSGGGPTQDGKDSPSPNGANGHRERGRFTKGNPGGPGNPHGAKYAAMTRVLRSAVSEDDIREIAQTLTGLAKAGDLQAVKLVLEYCVQKAPTKVETEHTPGSRPYRELSTSELLAELEILEAAAAEGAPQ